MSIFRPGAGARFSLGDTDLSRIGYPLGHLDVVRILIPGDSLTFDSMRRRLLQRYLRILTDGIQIVGTIGLGAATGGIQGDREMQWWCHDGVAGDTILELFDRIPAMVTALGANRAPHIIDYIIGSNDIFQGRTLTQIETDIRAVIEEFQDSWDGVWQVLNPPPLISANSGAGYEDRDALRLQVVDLYRDLANEYSNVLFCHGFDGLTPAHQLNDGTHCNEHGNAHTAMREALAIVSLTGRRLPPIGIVNPYYPSNSNALVFDTPATDAGTITSDVDLAPEQESFAVIIRFSLDAYPPDGSVYGIVSLGATLAAGYTIAVFKVANVAKAGISVYMFDGNSVISGNGGYPANLLELGKEYEICYIADAAEDKVFLGLNGQTVVHSVDLVNLGRGANWNLAAASTKLGRNVLNGIQGKIRRFEFYKGSSVPSIWDAPRFCEEKYRKGGVMPGNPLVYLCDAGSGNPPESQARAPAMTLSGVTHGTIP